MARIQIHDTVLDASGVTVSGATVTVRATDSSGNETGNATIYGSETGAAVANPLTTGSDGFFQFWTDPGRYNLIIAAVGFTPRTLRYDQVSGLGAPTTVVVEHNDVAVGTRGHLSFVDQFGTVFTVTDVPSSDRVQVALAAGDPPGIIKAYGGASAPSGYVLCDGAAYPRSGGPYDALFTAIGVAFGAGDGSTTFNVPDIRGRVPVGYSSTGPTLINALGKNDGRAANLRNISHHHTGSAFLGWPAAPGAHNTADSVGGPTSGDSNNTDYPAFVVVNWIIKT